jgi:hypothetical protein
VGVWTFCAPITQTFRAHQKNFFSAVGNQENRGSSNRESGDSDAKRCQNVCSFNELADSVVDFAAGFVYGPEIERADVPARLAHHQLSAPQGICMSKKTRVSRTVNPNAPELMLIDESKGCGKENLMWVCRAFAEAVEFSRQWSLSPADLRKVAEALEQHPNMAVV